MCCHCCCGPRHHEEERGHGRRFLTKAERLEELKKYAEELRKELVAVEEHIKELKSQEIIRQQIFSPFYWTRVCRQKSNLQDQAFRQFTNNVQTGIENETNKDGYP